MPMEHNISIVVAFWDRLQYRIDNILKEEHDPHNFFGIRWKADEPTETPFFFSIEVNCVEYVPGAPGTYCISSIGNMYFTKEQKLKYLQHAFN